MVEPQQTNLPESCTSVTRTIGNASSVDDDTEDAKDRTVSTDKDVCEFVKDSHEPDHGKNLDNGKDEFCLAITFDTKQIDADNDDQKYSNPCGRVDARSTWPVGQGNRSSNDFQRKRDEPR